MASGTAEAMLKACLDNFGRVDVLLLAAGHYPSASIEVRELGVELPDLQSLILGLAGYNRRALG
jgi:hypothetical protein